MTLNPDILAEFPYELDVFQRDACEAIERGEHVLVTAHTSAGKSTVAMYAIAKAFLENKRVIYTAPVKTLSNQKYAELKKRYGTDAGIQTGDFKVNPDAQCLVMTTEILRNSLFRTGAEGIHDDLAYVIFDECHYINDRERGPAWEESIMKLPDHVQMILLSATMANPEEFAEWIRRIKQRGISISSTLKRPVPLRFFCFVPNPGTFSEDLPWEEAERDGHLAVILDGEKGPFRTQTYATMQRRYEQAVSREWDNKKRDLTTGRKGVQEKNAAAAASKTRQAFQPIAMLNPFLNFLHINRQLPAIFFTLSRKKCDIYADKVQTCLIEHEERREVENIFEFHIRQLEDAEQYKQVTDLKKWLMKGVGAHHSGMLPILKEIVEVLFTKGLIKVLFATETLAIGVNTPTRVVCFLDVSKPSGHGSELRPLMVEEFKQMAGRAGRRGIDTIGNVIYFPVNDPISITEMETMMLGSIKKISSKFAISTHYILRSVNGGGSASILEQTQNSLMQRENNTMQHGCVEHSAACTKELEALTSRIEELDPDRSLRTVLDISRAAKTKGSSQSQQKQQQRNAEKALAELNKSDRARYDQVAKFAEQIAGLRQRIATLEHDQHTIPMMLATDIATCTSFLVEKGYLQEEPQALTIKGTFANYISQCHEVMITEAMLTRRLADPYKNDPQNLAAWLAVYIDEGSSAEDTGSTDLGRDAVEVGLGIYDELMRIGLSDGLGEFKLSTKYVDPVWEWCGEAHFQYVCQQYAIFEGNMVRALQKLVNLIDELKAAFEAINQLDWVVALDKTKALVGRGIINMDSIYIK